jgi:5S rRNA maturation endonuclease (ribonuclease M5)
MDNFDETVQKIKDENPIEEVIAECGHKFQAGGGKYWRVPHEGGLVVNVVKQRFFWATKGWNGDVVEFLTQEKGWEFKIAVEWLADRAGLDRPNWGKTDEAALKAHRLKLSVFEIAQQLFMDWLWKDEEALAYLRGRGFTDETIRLANMGFSGHRTDEQVRQMKGQFDMYGIAHDCPQAVTILGFKGDVAAWAQKWNIDTESGDWDRSWAEKRKLHGMMITPGIVYAHQAGGRTEYLSRRNMPGHDVIVEADGKERAWKSFNPQRCLVGTRMPYYNFAYHPKAEDCVIVEGPADAETFGQWGFAGTALCGVSADDEGIASLQGRLKRHKRLFLALDDDEAGRSKREKVAMAFGPLVRLVDWSVRNFEGNEADNDE